MSGRKKARPSFNEYPAGREPRASVVDKEQEHYYSNEIIEEEPDSDTDKKELEKLQMRKFIAKILVAIFILVLVIVLIVVIVSVTGTSDADGGTRVSPECVISNETTPETYQEFECDMIATLTTEDSTYLKTFASDTPHGKTIGWLTNDDDTDFLKTPIDEILERYVMALLYFSTEGNAWYSKYAFLSDNHVCDWVIDSSNTIRCIDKKITDIALHQNGMIGRLPTEIGYLTKLTRLYISRNQLTGKIPKALGSLAGMKLLYLSSNSFTGRIPTEINQLTLLERLHLQTNDVTGDLDSICDTVNAAGQNYQFHADCLTKRVKCSCCQACL